MDYLSQLLDRTTMYRTVIYVMWFYIAWAIIGSLIGQIYFSVFEMLASLIMLTVASLGAHFVCKTITGAPANVESTIITVLILFFLLDPVLSVNGLLIIAAVAVIAVVSKYILAWRKLHLFNPVALSVWLIALAGFGYATWWIANPWMFIPVLLGGLLITYKIRRFPLVIATVLSAVSVFVFLGLVKQQFDFQMVHTFFAAWPILFFATVMVTEPLATPAGRSNHIMYGILIGALSSTPFMFGPFYSSPELALLVGNLVFYWTTLRGRIRATLLEVRQLTTDTFEYVWRPSHKVAFKAGQYLEWSLPHDSKDIRGIRRYFSISSAPSGKHLSVSMKIPNQGSSFKQQIKNLKVDDVIYATSLDGDFVLPNETNTSIVMLAGGIGVTPFVSMIREEVANPKGRTIKLFYCNNTEDDIAFKELWKQVANTDIEIVNVVNKPSEGWIGEAGYINSEMLKNNNVNTNSDIFYISGPPAMVNAYKKMLKSLGVPNKRVKTDFFPGLG